MRIAQILNNKAHYIFEAEEMPNWPPYADGTRPLLIDISEKAEVQEGWDYDSETKEFTEPQPPEYVEPEPTPEPEPTQLDNIENMLLAKAIDDDYRFTLIEMSNGI